MRPSQSFIVRIWLESDAPTPAWRASLTDPKTLQRRFFSSAEGLAAFLGAWPDAVLSDDLHRPVSLEDT